MNKDIILQSNLLDIVFDDRNKDYGAYILRKEYNTRMRIAIFGMISISVIFCFIFLSVNSTSAVIKSVVLNIPDLAISTYHPKKIDVNKSIIRATVRPKASSNQFPPRIEKNINILPATPMIIQPSVTGTGDLKIDVHSALVSPGGGGYKHQLYYLFYQNLIKKLRLMRLM